MSHSADTSAVVAGIPGRTAPGLATALGAGGAVVGLLTFAGGLAMGETAWTWGALLVGIIYTMSIAMGGVIFAVMMSLTMAHWGRPIKRLGEALGLFLPVAWVLYVVFLVAGTGLYPWNPDTFLATGPVALEPHSPFALSTKPWWLSKWFFVGRQAAMTGGLILVALLYIRSSLSIDMAKAAAQLGDKAPSWWASLTGGVGTDEAAYKASEKTQQTLGIVIAMGYALIWSMVAFDAFMSLSPWWYANMFGAWFFMSSFWSALATLGIMALVLGPWLGIDAFITRSTTHDLGKLAFALCMFWAYTTYAQLLPIWYGQLPEETDFLLVRLYHPDWQWLSQAVAVLCFLMPFTVLLSRGIKKMKWPFIAILSVILVGLFLERTLVVMPSVHFEAPTLLHMLLSVGVLLFPLGLMVLTVTQVLARIPPLVIADKRLDPHPWDVHYHSLDHGHAHDEGHAPAK